MFKKIKSIGMLLVCLALFSPNLQSQDVTLGEAMRRPILESTSIRL
jgi:hypothetical protein